MYSQWQEGNLTRHDVVTRENVYIKPQPLEGDPAERYNWDAPINVSAMIRNVYTLPHSVCGVLMTAVTVGLPFLVT